MTPDVLPRCHLLSCGRGLLALGAAVLMACESGPTSLADSKTDVPAVDEVAVYAAVLAQHYGASFYVISDHTGTFPVEDPDASDELAYLQTEIPGLPIEMVASFCVRSDVAYPLSPNMDLGAPYELISQQELNAIFSAEDMSGWQRFYEKYPKATGSIRFTRVGFDATGNEALLMWRFQSDWLAGDGGFIVLDKIEGGWRVSNRIVTLVS